jgi:hypothetical protein
VSSGSLIVGIEVSHLNLGQTSSRVHAAWLSLISEREIQHLNLKPSTHLHPVSSSWLWIPPHGPYTLPLRPLGIPIEINVLVCRFFCIHETTWEWMNIFLWKLILGTYINIYWHIPVVILCIHSLACEVPLRNILQMSHQSGTIGSIGVVTQLLKMYIVYPAFMPVEMCNVSACRREWCELFVLQSHCTEWQFSLEHVLPMIADLGDTYNRLFKWVNMIDQIYDHNI